MAADIILDDLTNGALDTENNWNGTGVFDKLIMAVNSNIEGQYNKGRINGADYANVYLGSMQSVIAQSMQFLLQEQLVEAQIDNALKDVDIKERQALVAEAKQADSELTSAKNRLVLEAQEALYKRQKAGFDDNKHQKILDTQMNAWGITFQDTDTTFVPNQIGQTEFDTSFAATRQDYDI